MDNREADPLLTMVASDEHGLAEHVTVHRVDDGGARVGGLLRRRRHRDVELDVERVELERVVVVRSRPAPGPM